MAKSEHGAEVQAYLDKHKITKLFEDLLSNVVKELPANPLDFLITKLQSLKQKKKLVPPSAGVGARSKLQISGSAVATKTKSPASAKTSGLQKPTLSSSSSPSLPKTTPSKSLHPPTTSSIPKPGRSTPRAVGSKLKPPATTPSRPTTAPTTSKTTPKSTASTSLQSKLPGTSPSKLKSPRTTATGGRRVGQEKGAVPAKGQSLPATSPTKPKTKATSPVPKPEKPVPQAAAVKQVPKPVPKLVSPEEELDEFFGEGKKASSRHYQTHSDEEEEEFEVGQKVEEWSEEEEGVGGGGRSEHEIESSGEVDLDDIIRQRKSSKPSKQAFLETLLATPTSDGSGATPSSEGYVSEEESEGEEGGVEVVEDYEALEEEGVTGLTKSKYAVREAPPPQDQTTVDLRLQICARCARVISGADDVTASESLSMVTQPAASEVDFESVSQVGSHASFPQWNPSSASEASASRLPQSDASETSSDVTLQSHSTWGDLAPQPRPQAPPSDVESEVQLPPPAPLDGQPWSRDTPPQRDPYGWAQ